MTLTKIHLVADIGGTNIRLGLSQEGDHTTIDQLEVYQCDRFDSLADVVQDYLQAKLISKHDIYACFAIACPVEDDLISMTNLPWEFSKSALQQRFNFKRLILINDYTAIAHAVPYLSEQQKVKIGRGQAKQNKPIAICGPGTGLGVANVVPSNEGWLSLGGEGGHVDFAPTDKAEIAILEYLLTKYQHVSYEQLLSGLGLEQIYQAITHISGEQAVILSAKEISEKAINKSCYLCEQALAQFCKTLGSFAGNLALTMASFGGVYIAGGIVPRFINYIENSEFRTRFEEKGRFNNFNREIATYVITETQPGLLGASAYLHQQINTH